MEFEQHKRKHLNQQKYHTQNIHFAREFVKEILVEMKELVKSCVLFGSNTHNTLKKDSDIDLLIILDNVSVYVSPELRESYQIISKKLTSQISDKLHIMTLNLSDVWDMARKGDPLFINILRYGVPLFDRDIVEPMQYLLETGKIRPTTESVINFKARSQRLLEDCDKHLENCYFDLYYSLVDGVHALLMSHEITPPSPKEMSSIVANHFSTKKGKELSGVLVELYSRVKEIEYREGGKIQPKEIELARKKVEKVLYFCFEEIDKKI